MVLRRYIWLVIFVLFPSFSGLGQEVKIKADNKAKQSVGEQNLKKSSQNKITAIPEKKTLQLFKKRNPKAKKPEDEILKVKAVPSSAKNIDALKIQTKRTTMGQMHKMNKAMRKTMMRHKHM